MGPVARRRAARAGRMVLALGAALVLVWIGRRNASDLGRVHLRLDPRWLVAGLPFYALGSLWLAIGWRAELDAFGYRLPVTVAIRVWWRAQLARYVPTGLAAFASRAALARQEGVPASIGAASLALELVALIGWGSLVAAVGLPSSLLPLPLRLVLGAGAAAGLAALPVAYPRLAAVGRRVPALETLATTPAARPRLYGSLAWYGASIAIRTIAFCSLTAALVVVHAADVWLLAGAVMGAAVIGIVGITPAGIGVRETAMVGLLGHRFGTTDAAAIAVAWRAYEFGFELVWLAIGSIVSGSRSPGHRSAEGPVGG